MNFGTTKLIKPLGIVATVQKKKKRRRQSGLTKWHCRCTMQKHCMHIRAFIYKKKEYKSMIEKKMKKKEVHIEQTKSTVAFTHSSNKCQNIFTKHLFLVVAGHNFIYILLF